MKRAARREGLGLRRFRQGETVTLGDLCAFIEEKGLAGFKWPESLVVMEALPRNVLAKLVRSQLEF